MEKTKAKRFWQKIWDIHVAKQRYSKAGYVKKGFEDITDSYMVAQAIWNMSDKEFEEIISLASSTTLKRRVSAKQRL